MTMTSRLLLLVLIASTPALLIQGYTEISLRRTSEERLVELAGTRARMAAAEQARIVEGIRQVLIVLAQLPAVRDRDSAACGPILRRLQPSYPSYSSFAATDAAGRTYCISVDVPPEGIPSVADRFYFQQAMAEKDFVVGEYAIGRASGKRLLHFAYPILDGERAMGVVVAALHLDELAQSMTEAGIDDDALLVTDRNGTVLVANNEPGVVVGSHVGEPVAGLLASGRAGMREAAGSDGKTKVYALVPVTANAAAGGLQVAIGLDKAAAMAPVDRTTRRGALLILTGLAAALAAAWLVGRAFIQAPVNALLDAAGQWEAGNLSARAPILGSGSELSRLAAAFNRMAEHLEDVLRRKDILLREINHRVMNSFQTLASLIVIQQTRSEDGAVREALQNVHQRVTGLALVHRRLYQSTEVNRIEFAEYVEELCADLSHALVASERRIAIDVEVGEMWLKPDQAVPLGLIVAELVANAVKHAFPEGRGRIRVASEGSPERGFALVVEDNGRGLSGTFDRGWGLGMRVVSAMAGQLGARLEIGREHTGARFRVVVPAPKAAVDHEVGPEDRRPAGGQA